MELLNFLIKEKHLKTPKIIEAFSKVKREDFIPEGFQHLAQYNQPVPIGKGQTISQPQVVAFMLEELMPRPGEKILDIGAGSGWTTALLAQIVSQKKGGKVIALELLPEIAEFGKKNIQKYDFKVVDFLCLNAVEGYEKEAPYDKILVSASIKKIPQKWKEQLKVGGRIVASVESSILVIEKEKEKFKEKEYFGFSFVPFKS